MDSSLLNSIGNRLRTRRMELHLTQSQIAELLGMSLNFYGGIERGKKRLSLEKMLLVYKKLDLDLTYLLTGEKPIYLSLDDIISDCPQGKRFDLEQLIKHAVKLLR